MKLRLKALAEQVVVITGASSGIGLATARMAAAAGARVVAVARSDDALRQLVEEIHARGGQALHVEADVSDERELRRAADEARRVFGGFDTWVNNAGVSVYGHVLDVSIDDMRRLFETNFWGVVHGSRIACEELRGRGGALINVGSEGSDKALPLQTAYSASKHAVKGWTDGLRMELEADGAPISVTLIKPGPIDTPFTQHARSYLADQPKHIPPVYAPESVAEGILYAATTPLRDLYIGGGARLASAMDKLAPRLMDKAVARTMIRGTHSGRPPRRREALYGPGGDLHERGDYPGVVRKSLYTGAVTHPLLAGAAAVAMAVLAAAMWHAPHGTGAR